MADKKDKDVVDLGKLAGRLWKKKKTFFKVWAVVFVIACIYIVSLPRYYTTEIKLAPEMESSFTEGALGNIASSFGFDFGSMATSDAISPELYPELLGTNDFVTLLFPMMVETADGTVRASYYDYLTKHQKSPWWSGIKNAIFSIFPKSEDGGGQPSGEVNPQSLTRQQNEVAEKIKASIGCFIDRKTSLITINVTDQDARISATIADSIRLKLQEFIIDYRTKKARIDVDYFAKLVDEAHAEYEQARQAYARYADSHVSSVLESVNSTKADLENDMQLKLNNYTAYNTQLQSSIAKLQQRTPSFTLLQSASIPVKPSGPKRMIFVFVMLVLATIVTTARILMKGEGEPAATVGSDDSSSDTSNDNIG